MYTRAHTCLHAHTCEHARRDLTRAAPADQILQSIMTKAALKCILSIVIGDRIKHGMILKNHSIHLSSNWEKDEAIFAI